MSLQRVLKMQGHQIKVCYVMYRMTLATRASYRIFMRRFTRFELALGTPIRYCNATAYPPLSSSSCGLCAPSDPRHWRSGCGGWPCLSDVHHPGYSRQTTSQCRAASGALMRNGNAVFGPIGFPARHRLPARAMIARPSALFHDRDLQKS